MLIKYSVIHYFLVEKVNTSLQRDPRNTTADLVIFWLAEKQNSLWDSVWTSHTSMKPRCCILWGCCLPTSCLITAQLWSSVPGCGSCSDSWGSSRQWTHSEGVWKGNCHCLLVAYCRAHCLLVQLQAHRDAGERVRACRRTAELTLNLLVSKHVVKHVLLLVSNMLSLAVLHLLFPHCLSPHLFGHFFIVWQSQVMSCHNHVHVCCMLCGIVHARVSCFHVLLPLPLSSSLLFSFHCLKVTSPQSVERRTLQCRLLLGGPAPLAQLSHLRLLLCNAKQVVQDNRWVGIKISCADGSIYGGLYRGR